MNKVILEPRFINNLEISPADKWILVMLLNSSIDGKVSRGLLNSVYNQTYPQLYSNTLIFTFDETNLAINLAMLRTVYGISISIPRSTEELPNFNYVEGAKILNAYNQVRHKFWEKQGNVNVPPIQFTISIHKALCRLAQFFEVNKINDYYLYFYTLFKSTNWGIVWGLNQCAATTCLDRYITNKSSSLSEIEQEAAIKKREKESEIKKATGEAESRWFTLFPHIESIKTKYVKNKQAEICYNNMDLTLGYHPKSGACNTCPLKDMCAEKINTIFKEKTQTQDLDIIQIRDRVISVQEAKEKIKNKDFDFYN